MQNQTLATQFQTGIFAPALENETRAALDTETAAFHLGRKPQTLRAWACLENGPIRPIRVNRRLAWRVADIKALLGVPA